MSAATTSSSKSALFCGAIVSVVALLLYGWTRAARVTLVDSGELILAADRLGVAHPPGFPLWVMLAHAATLVPWGNVAVRVNFSSALFGALASGTLALAVAELLIAGSYVSPTKQDAEGATHVETA